MSSAGLSPSAGGRPPGPAGTGVRGSAGLPTATSAVGRPCIRGVVPQVAHCPGHGTDRGGDVGSRRHSPGAAVGFPKTDTQGLGAQQVTCQAAAVFTHKGHVAKEPVRQQEAPPLASRRPRMQTLLARPSLGQSCPAVSALLGRGGQGGHSQTPQWPAGGGGRGQPGHLQP